MSLHSPTQAAPAPAWHLPELAEDGDDPTLLFALANEQQRWSCVVRIELMDEVPHLVTTLASTAGAAAITAVEVAQLRTPLVAAHRRTIHAQRELQVWLDRFDLACARRRQFQPRGGGGAFAIPLVDVAPGQALGYRVRLWHGDTQIGALQGAFFIADGQVVAW